MKKLMFAVAAVVMAAGVQAAQYTWQAESLAAGFAPTYIEDSEECWYGAKGTAYIYRSADFARDTIVAAIQDGSWTSAGAFGTVTFMDGALDANSPSGQSLYKGENFYAVLVADEATDWEGNVTYTAGQDYFYVTTEGTVPGTATDIGTSLVYMGDQWDTTIGLGDSTTGWYAQSVPEPTSGLLLLLGVAGLALKRRRA